MERSISAAPHPGHRGHPQTITPILSAGRPWGTGTVPLGPSQAPHTGLGSSHAAPRPARHTRRRARARGTCGRDPVEPARPGSTTRSSRLPGTAATTSSTTRWTLTTCARPTGSTAARSSPRARRRASRASTSTCAASDRHAARRRPRRALHARGPGADRHPAYPLTPAIVHRHRRLRRPAPGDHRPRRLERGLGHHRGRRVRGQRAAGLTRLVPANDNPRDKATFDIAITVPEGITAIANGRLLSKATRTADDLALGGGLADGAVPCHRHQRRLRAARIAHAATAPDLPRGRPVRGARLGDARQRAGRRSSTSSPRSMAGTRSAAAAG